MKSELRFRFWVYLLIIGLCILCDTRCASHQLNVKAAEQVAANGRAAELVDAWLPAGPDRDFVKKALKESSATIKKQAAAVEVAEQKATEAESDAEKWRRLKIGLFSAATLAALFGAWRVFRAAKG